VHHGAATRFEETLIAVSATRVDDRLCLRVTDNGSGLPEKWDLLRDAGIDALLDRCDAGDGTVRFANTVLNGVPAKLHPAMKMLGATPARCQHVRRPLHNSAVPFASKLLTPCSSGGIIHTLTPPVRRRPKGS